MRSEFEFIQNIKKKYLLGHIGDDCAVLPKDDRTDLLITSDMLVEDVDFRLTWTTPEFLGHKALAVSLSDIAAMGGEPKFALLSLGVSENLWKTDFVDRFYEGWHELARQFGIELIGGDISRSSDKLVVDSTVVGDVPKDKAILRSGAKIGDAIFITGFLGGAAAGLKLLESGRRFDDSNASAFRHKVLRQLQPLPQVKTGKLLSQHNLTTSMLDVSDGLSSDLQHLLTASGCGAELFGDLIPVDPALDDDDPSNALKMALHGGEDFELLFTTDPSNVAHAKDFGFHYVGNITAKIGIIELICTNRSEILTPKGFQHF